MCKFNLFVKPEKLEYFLHIDIVVGIVPDFFLYNKEDIFENQPEDVEEDSSQDWKRGSASQPTDIHQDSSNIKAKNP